MKIEQNEFLVAGIAFLIKNSEDCIFDYKNSEGCVF
jgi:hypothetical protein